MEPRAIWHSFCERVAERDERLVGELRATIAMLQGLVRDLARAASAIAADRPRDGSLGELARLYEAHAPALLLGPIDACQRRSPQRRVLDAFDDYDRALERSIRTLPEALSAPGPEWLDILEGQHLGWVARSRLRWSRQRDVFFRPALLYEARVQRVRRRAIEGRLLVALAELNLDMLVPWQAMRRAWLAPTTGEPAGATPEAELARLEQRVLRQGQQADAATADLSDSLARARGRAARTLARRRAPRADRVDRLSARDDRHREFLGHQARAVDADLELAAQLARAEERLMTAARELLAAVETEHRELLADVSGVVDWLDSRAPGDGSSFPRATARIVPTVSRVRAFSRTADAVLLSVPASLEVSARLSPKPRAWRSWTVQTPRTLLQAALAAQTLPALTSGLGVLERQHQGIMLEIERAREVVAFAAETARAESDADLRIEQEGIENARTLLEFHRQQSESLPADVERSVAGGIAEAIERTHRLLNEGQIGVWRQMARHGGPRAAQLLWRRTGEQAGAGAEGLTRLAALAYRRALAGIGWMPAPPVAARNVIARGYLTRMLGAEAKLEQLPLIYQRLFRLVPIEDPRFLIGRQDELAAISEARQLWEDGRDAAVILVGARGSGKTSLLNCACQSSLAGVPVIRSEFVERLTTRDEMFAFLGQLLDTPPDEVEQALASERRVIVVEEMERTFLRVAHGFDAVRTLLSLISRTSRQTLWIVSINYSCFRLLNAALRLEPHFSHRINAMAVEPAHLREAVLTRHSLSGLRLRFASRNGQRTYTRRLRQAAGMPADAESDFFDVLYRESGGVFRSAFALWQRYIDRADAGVLYMKPPTPSQDHEIVASLDTLDLFTLAALLQHGSLTPREHSVVFRIDETRSRSWLDNLLARELIEPDPGRYGFRVVPEAAQIVRQALFRRNLA